MGFKKLAFLTHVLEDVFDYARSGLLEIDEKIINEMFGAFDALDKALASIKKTGKETNLSAITNKIKKITGVKTEGVGKSKRTKSGKPVGAKKKKKISGNREKRIQRKQPGEEEAVTAATKSAEFTHIKVPVERLDKLMDLMEELLIDKMRLRAKSVDFPEIKETVEHLDRLVSDIQYQVMQARLVPVEQIFARFPRMVRDLSKKEKKQVGFEVSGGDLELDRTVIDGLAQPLVHLLRNAVDHGIAKKGKIRLTAKREKDYALINVTNWGQSIDWEKVISKAADRDLISPETKDNLMSRLRENPLVPDREIQKLLFNPRLSTKDKITETSGRGVGLSVVKKFADQLGGRVMIESPLLSSSGKGEDEKIKTEDGASFTLELPLSLAIIKALLVRANGSKFAIPFSSIERTVRVPHQKIKSLGDQDVAVVGGIEVPLARLRRVFGFSQPDLAEDETDKDEKVPAEIKKAHELSVIVRRGRDIAGIVVDELLGEEEITVKPLPRILQRVRGFSGATIMGDGRTLLILDVVGLLENTQKLLRK